MIKKFNDKRRSDMFYRIQADTIKIDLLQIPCSKTFQLFTHRRVPEFNIAEHEIIIIAFFFVYYVFPPFAILIHYRKYGVFSKVVRIIYSGETFMIPYELRVFPLPSRESKFCVRIYVERFTFKLI